MKLNTKVRYGLRAMIEIGLKKNKTGVLQKIISENQEISEKYLDHIISDLKKEGLIINAGGKKSGYILNKLKSKITVYDIYKAFESDISIIQCICSPKVCKRSKKCTARDFWSGLNDEISAYMKGISLADLVKWEEENSGSII
ncbi:MAG: hypothetical protein A2275_11025 [Bacteroidetes bacterium RIFOXYA12_FULL_35_11]|nr:MAG: hypothetical protein A2X01_16065 [Bacteroidetes bacterium GWF2_35_48]OFY77346.1 MAG: hypothetical protein A2275_11025 [Bacteroidetes bacterium RIFOXYA12_FULL_35_11]OFY99762.1 MAG: hypothetical protein A2491_10965 [Bacteroidetes bacterium RIFOXYC12_FULL_35_7]HBX50917.1 Rrf2 family transcriptional regulator [Bacteroidales bacterium]